MGNPYKTEKSLRPKHLIVRKKINKIIKTYEPETIKYQNPGTVSMYKTSEIEWDIISVVLLSFLFNFKSKSHWLTDDFCI